MAEKTITKAEYEEYKKLKKQDNDFKAHFIRSLKQIEEGKLIPV
jgi:hypothetical protein